LRESTGATYSFTHDKIRDAVYVEAGEARRRVFHRRAVDTLQSEAPAAELARHALAAGLDDLAAQFSLRAGADAMHLLAAPDAIVHFERALRIGQDRAWPRSVAEARMRRAEAYASIGRWAEARADLELVLDGLGAEDVEPRAEVVAKLAEACYWV